MRTTLTRALAGTAIAATAVLAAAGTASAATATPAPTTLTISAAKSTILRGGSDLLTGTLTTGTTPTALPGRVVWLDRVVGTKLVAVDVDLTGKFGHVFFTVKPTVTTTYEMVFKGGANYAASNSSPLTVTVIQPRIPTSLGIKDTNPIIKPGGSDTIIGTLLAGLKPVSGKVVYLDRIVAGKLVPVEVDLTGAAGHVFFKVSPKSTTSYELVFKGTAKYAPSHSGTLKVVVL